MPPAATIPAAAEVFRNRRRVNGWRIRMLMRSSEAAGEFLASRNRHQVHESLMTSGPSPLPACGERSVFAALLEKVGGGGTSPRVGAPSKGAFTLHESALVERPPHPDPLPASGEREQTPHICRHQIYISRGA